MGKLPADPLQVLFPPPPRPPSEGVTRPSYVHDLRSQYGGMLRGGGVWRVALWPGHIVDGIIVVNRRTGGCHDHHGLPRAY